MEVPYLRYHKVVPATPIFAKSVFRGDETSLSRGDEAIWATGAKSPAHVAVWSTTEGIGYFGEYDEGGVHDTVGEAGV